MINISELNQGLNELLSRSAYEDASIIIKAKRALIQLDNLRGCFEKTMAEQHALLRDLTKINEKLNIKDHADICAVCKAPLAKLPK